MRATSFFLIPVLFFSCFAVSASAQPIVLQDLVRTDQGRVSLSIESSDAATEILARRAFGLHGAVRVNSVADSTFKVNIEKSGEREVLLTVGSGEPYQEQLRRTVSGSNFRDAVLRACDVVIEATLQTPGFFAGKLAFVVKNRGVSEVFTSDLLFNQVRQMTQDRSLVTGPRWSPDGSRILYTTYFKSGFPDIYSLDARSGLKQPIATYKGTNTGGSYSPDGLRIAMTLSGPGNSEIFIADNQGKDVRRLTTNKSLEASPSWSPDGSRLVYTSDVRGRPQLYTISVNGGAPQRLPTNISRYCSEPVWNPKNPNLIAFTAAIGGGFQIAVYDMRTRASKQLTRGASSVEPYWLNDGRHLVYTQRDQGRTRLMLLDSETGKISALHQPGLGDASAASFVY